MPIIANTTSGNTFSAIRAQLNSVTKRMNQFAVNESTLYANTINANTVLKISGTDVRATFAQNTYVKSVLANTNSYIATRATWTSVTGTNTALRTLVSDRLQVANASATYATKASPTTSGLLAHTGRATISTNLSVSGNATVTGTMTATGIVSGSELTSTLASGDEGGQINLAKPPNATTNGGVTIDAYQNRLRIFEQGGTARGVYIDLTAASAGVGTNLLAGGGGSSGASWAALLATNTAIRALDSQKISVANAAAAYVAKSGSTMTGNLILSGSAVIKLATSGENARATGIQNASGLDLGYFDRSFTYFDDRASNCNGIIPNGNCAGNSTWDPPNLSWWTWGISGVSSTTFSNDYQFDYKNANAWTYYNIASTSYNYDSYYLSVAEIGGDQYRRNYRNCNCNCNCANWTQGPFNCRSNCNCNCNC